MWRDDDERIDELDMLDAKCRDAGLLNMAEMLHFETEG